MRRFSVLAVALAMAVGGVSAAPVAADGGDIATAAKKKKKKKKKVTFGDARAVTALNILEYQFNDPAFVDGEIEGCTRISRVQVNCDAYILRAGSPARIDWTQVVKPGRSYKINVVNTP